MIYLNDEREIVQEWKDIDEFLEKLSKEEVVYKEKPKLISAWTSLKLLAKVNEFKKKHQKA